jgi:uncharacterized repeat protein (TIGR01451 family)
MKYLKRIGATAVIGLVSLLPQAAFALGTVAGTDITNVASVGYTVGTVAQTAVSSNSVVFKVDRRINLLVAEVGGAATISVPNSTVQVTTFTVTNSSNAPLDFRLGAVQTANGTTLPFGGTDNFDGTNLQVFVDSNGNNTYDAGTDTVAFLDEIGADTTRTVFVVMDVPSTLLLPRVNGDRAGVVLTATAAESGTASTLGADSVQTTVAETPGTVDTVFGDPAGYSEIARSGSHSAIDQYNVSTATITVTKTSRVVSDPFNNTTLPKAIPGAVVEYCVQVANTGGAPATSVTVSDAIPANTTYSAGTIFAGTTVTAGVCNADGTAEDDNNTGADETDPNGGSFNGTNVFGTIPSVATGATTAVRFRVTIN